MAVPVVNTIRLRTTLLICMCTNITFVFIGQSVTFEMLKLIKNVLAFSQPQIYRKQRIIVKYELIKVGNHNFLQEHAVVIFPYMW